MAIVSFNTETDNYEDAVALLKTAFGIAGLGSKTSESTDSTASGKNFWNFERLQKWTQRLTPAAAEAVRYVAAHAPATPMDDVISHLGNYLGEANFTGQQMGGRMASIGFASKAVGADEAPLQTDYWDRHYRMSPDIASILSEIMGSASEDPVTSGSAPPAPD